MSLSANSSALSDALPLAPEALALEWPQNTVAVGDTHGDDLRREVYCILGLPIDAVDMPAVVSNIESAAARRAPFVLSTPNLNFLVCARTDATFRESVLLSDLCPPDGMPIVWIARLTGVPIRRRVAGSDIFDALMAKRHARPLKVFLFGGAEGIAAAASNAINEAGRGISCVGSMSPGYGSVEELSRADVIEEINASKADFLMASLGALKGQLWLQRNRHRLGVPVRAHLGAVINFQARTLQRAPLWMKNCGLEWLWRIKEEPYLWRRYLHDGLVLLRLLLTHVIPLAAGALWARLKGAEGEKLIVAQAPSKGLPGQSVTVSLIGAATAAQIDAATPCLRDALKARAHIIIDLSRTRSIDARFFGLLLMLRKQLAAHGGAMTFTGVSARMARLFRLNGLTYLLARDGV